MSFLFKKYKNVQLKSEAFLLFMVQKGWVVFKKKKKKSHFIFHITKHKITVEMKLKNACLINILRPVVASYYGGLIQCTQESKYNRAYMPMVNNSEIHAEKKT